jgi:hypothetical protein
MSTIRDNAMDRTAAATFNSPTRAGEVSTMTSGAPNLVTDNQSVATVPPSIVAPDTTTLGAGSSSLSMDQCGSNNLNCSYIPD